MDKQQNISFSEMIDEIRRLCGEKASGMLFFNSDSGHLAQIGLAGGKIISLSCLKKQGLEAIPLIQKMRSGRFRFAAMDIPEKSSLPSALDILEALSEESNSPDKSVVASEVLSPKKVEILQGILAEYIGPIALLICNQLLGTSLESALDTLAQEIANPQQARQFKEKARRSLQ